MGCVLKKKNMDLWITIAILVIVVSYHVSVQIVGGVKDVIDPAVASQISNALFIWLIGLLWIAYQRWRKIMRRGFMLEDIFLSTGQEVLMVIDAEGRIEMCNDAVEPVFGYTASDMAGRPSLDILGDRRRDPANEEEIETSLAEIGFHRGEATATTRDGEALTVEVHTGRRKQGLGQVLMIQDITERKEHEERLRIAKETAEQATREKDDTLVKLEASYQRLRELEIHRDSLIHMVCHDMKAPLQVLILQLDLLKEMIIEKLDNDELESVDTLLAYSRQLEVMVHSMLDLSKLEAGSLPLRLKPHDIRESIEEALRFLASMRGEFDVATEVDEVLQSVPYDRDIVHRILLNLLINAAKYSPPGGKITVGVDHEGDCIRIRVTDEGPGIPEQHQEAIFEKFGQVHMEGHYRKGSTGLGLTFCKLATEAHGGRIGVVSSVNQGSTFWFTLPVIPAPAPVTQVVEVEAEQAELPR